MYKTRLFAFSLLLISGSVYAQNLDTSLCDDFSGAAFGFCMSAIHLECGTGDENSEDACTKIGDNFYQLTGEIPPWNPCRYWNTRWIVDFFGNDPAFCFDETSPGRFGDENYKLTIVNNDQYGLGSFYPGVQNQLYLVKDGILGFSVWLSNEEHASCFWHIEEAIDILGLTCSGDPFP